MQFCKWGSIIKFSESNSLKLEKNNSSCFSEEKRLKLTKDFTYVEEHLFVMKNIHSML